MNIDINSTVHYRFFVFMFNLSMIILSLIIIIFVSMPVQLQPTTQRATKWSTDGNRSNSKNDEPLTESIRLKGASNGWIPFDTVNVTNSQLNFYLGLESETYLSSTLRDIGRCRIAIERQRNSQSKADERHRIYVSWLRGALIVAVLQILWSIVWYIHARLSSDISYNLFFNAFIELLYEIAWIVVLGYFIVRRRDIGLYFIEIDNIREMPYYEESSYFHAAGAFVVIVSILKLALIVLWCWWGVIECRNEIDDFDRSIRRRCEEIDKKYPPIAVEEKTPKVEIVSEKKENRSNSNVDNSTMAESIPVLTTKLLVVDETVDRSQTGQRKIGDGLKKMESKSGSNIETLMIRKSKKSSVIRNGAFKKISVTNIGSKRRLSKKSKNLQKNLTMISVQ